MMAWFKRAIGVVIVSGLLALAAWMHFPDVAAIVAFTKWTGVEALAPLEAQPMLAAAIAAGLAVVAFLWRAALGILLVVALLVLGDVTLENYGTFQRIDQLTGVEALRPLRAWLFEFRLPLLAVAGFLVLTWLSTLWQRLGLGY